MTRRESGGKVDQMIQCQDSSVIILNHLTDIDRSG